MGRWVESQTDLKHIGIEIAIMEAVLESNKLIVIRKGIVWVESEQTSLLDLKRIASVGGIGINRFSWNPNF